MRPDRLTLSQSFLLHHWLEVEEVPDDRPPPRLRNSDSPGRLTDLELVVVRSKIIAHMLVVELNGSEQATFQARISEVEHLFREDVVRRMRRIGAIRNDLVHTVGVDSLRNRALFNEDCDVAERSIKEAKHRKLQTTSRAAQTQRKPAKTGCLVLLSTLFIGVSALSWLFASPLGFRISATDASASHSVTAKAIKDIPIARD